MTKKEFENLQPGEMVEITVHGKNKGKQGIVAEVTKDTEFAIGVAYLVPVEGTFEFAKDQIRTETCNKHGLFGWNRYNLKRVVRKRISTEFYVHTMYGGKEISWPAENFTDNELKVVDKFMGEFNKHVSGQMIDGMAIINKYENLKGDKYYDL